MKQDVELAVKERYAKGALQKEESLCCPTILYDPKFLKVIPNFSIHEWARTEPYTGPDELQRYVEGLRKAGLPE